MTADAMVMYPSFKEFFGDNTVDLDDGAFRFALLTSSYTPSSSHETWNDLVSAEVANGNGYATHGVALTSTWVRSGSQVTFDAANISWTGSGSGFSCRYGAIVHDADANGALATTDKLVGYFLLDNTPADITRSAGANLNINFSDQGIFRI